MPSHSAVTQVRNLLDANAHSYRNIVMVGRTHLQLISWVAQLNEALAGIRQALSGVFALVTGRNGSLHGHQRSFPLRRSRCRRIAEEIRQPFVSAANNFAARSAHDVGGACAGWRAH
jgi:Fumarase